MFRQTRLVAVGLVLSVCGCILDKPLSDPKTSKVDERLLGRWVGVATPTNTDFEHSLLLIGRHANSTNPSGIMESLAVGYDEKERRIVGADETKVAYFSISRIGDLDLMNVFYEQVDEDQEPVQADLSSDGGYATWAENPKRSVCLVRYVVDGDTIKFYLADPLKLDALAREGKLKKSGEFVTAESLAPYLAKNGGEGLFLGEDDAAIYKRLK